MGVVLSDLIFGSIALILGFLLGTFIDIIFYNIYKRIDSTATNTWALLLVFIAQVIVLVLSISLTNLFFSKDTISSTVFTSGLVSSQIFMMNYVIQRVSNTLYNRKENPITTSLTNISSRSL